MGENLSDIASFFLGVCLTCEGNLDLARIHWKDLLDRTTAKIKVAHPLKYRAFHAMVDRWYRNNEFYWAVVYYNKELIANIGSRDSDQQASTCRAVLDALAPRKLGSWGHNGTQDWMNCKSADLLHFRAILDFHFGDIREARRKVEAALKLNPNGAKELFSLGFINLWQGKFGPALKYFQRVEKTAVLPAIIINLLEFYQALIKQHPDRPELRFGLAFINDGFCDSSTALNDYTLFRKQSKDKPQYDKLRSFTQERLVKGWSAEQTAT